TRGIRTQYRYYFTSSKLTINTLQHLQLTKGFLQISYFYYLVHCFILGNSSFTDSGVRDGIALSTLSNKLTIKLRISITLCGICSIIWAYKLTGRYGISPFPSLFRS